MPELCLVKFLPNFHLLNTLNISNTFITIFRACYVHIYLVS